MPQLPDCVLLGKWRVVGKIGRGSFGEVFVAIDEQTKERVAVKRELQKRDLGHLKVELAILQQLTASRNHEHLPRLYAQSIVDHPPFDALIMTLLGPSTGHVKTKLSRARLGSLWELKANTLITLSGFDLRVVAQIGLQMTDALEAIHGAGYVYRDLKPENILVRTFVAPPAMQGAGPCVGLQDLTADVVLVDFGLCDRYLTDDGRHVPRRKEGHKKRAGTAKYAPSSTHAGFRTFRRGDLESLVYTLLDLAMSHLPWAHVAQSSSDRLWSEIGRLKKEWCQDVQEFLMYSREPGRSDSQTISPAIPVKLLQLLQYAQQMRMEDPVDWPHVRRELQALAAARSPQQQAILPLFLGIPPAQVAAIEPLMDQPWIGEHWGLYEYDAARQEEEDEQQRQSQQSWNWNSTSKQSSGQGCSWDYIDKPWGADVDPHPEPEAKAQQAVRAGVQHRGRG
ncbi:hypothetical protein RI367_004502 [Sorochytrium milnesiophthora]